MAKGINFPFGVSRQGGITLRADEDSGITGKMTQVLFTAPGERVNQPTFGCGLNNLVFDPNNAILAAATEFTVGQALSRWLGAEIAVGGVDIRAAVETITVEIAYLRRGDNSRNTVRFHVE